jgi:translation initiation factor 3 subunit M
MHTFRVDHVLTFDFLLVYHDNSLSNIFNTLPANSPLRLSVFTAIVDLAVASDDMDLVLPQLQYVPSWISEWGVGAEAERALLLTLSDRLKKSGNE